MNSIAGLRPLVVQCHKTESCSQRYTLFCGQYASYPSALGRAAAGANFSKTSEPLFCLLNSLIARLADGIVHQSGIIMVEVEQEDRYY